MMSFWSLWLTLDLCRLDWLYDRFRVHGKAVCIHVHYFKYRIFTSYHYYCCYNISDVKLFHRNSIMFVLHIHSHFCWWLYSSHIVVEEYQPRKGIMYRCTLAHIGYTYSTTPPSAGYPWMWRRLTGINKKQMSDVNKFSYGGTICEIRTREHFTGSPIKPLNYIALDLLKRYSIDSWSKHL